MAGEGVVVKTPVPVFGGFEGKERKGQGAKDGGKLAGGVLVGR